MASRTRLRRLTRLPGVGARTAHRFAFHLLRVPSDEANALAVGLRRFVSVDSGLEVALVESDDPHGVVGKRTFLHPTIVSAALMLFSTIATLFWYVLRLLSSRD